MSEEESNKALAQRWFHEGWSLGNLDVADEIFAADFALRGRIVGPEGPKRSVAARRAAFADMTVEIGVQLAQGPMVATQFTTHARHVGPFAGVAPTGNWVTAEGIVIWRLRDGWVVEDWNAFDQWGIVAQIDPAIRARGNPRARSGR